MVPFSCKRRGFCPSCGGRRMAERAAYLVDEVLPQVPVRQWVLTLPYRLRYRLAWDHALCRAVLVSANSRRGDSWLPRCLFSHRREPTMGIARAARARSADPAPATTCRISTLARWDPAGARLPISPANMGVDATTVAHRTEPRSGTLRRIAPTPRGARVPPRRPISYGATGGLADSLAQGLRVKGLRDEGGSPHGVPECQRVHAP